MAFAHYSNLFTSGLLSDSPISSESSPASSPWSLEDDLGYGARRRGSLPMDSLDSASSSYSRYSTSAQSSRALPESLASGDSFYFTTPSKRRRNPAYFRSFLSLDLAESQSVQASLKRMDSKLSMGMVLSPAIRSSASSHLSP